MSSNSLALTSSRHWGARNRYESSNDDDYGHYVVPMPLHYRPEEGRGIDAPWRLFEERVRTGPYGLSSFPLQPYSPVRILILGPAGAQERVNPRLRQFIRDSPPRIRNDWHLGFANHEPDNPSLTEEEFKKAMKKLRKATYTPPQPRRSGLRGIFRARNSSSIVDSKVEADGEKKEGNCCTICLEDFVLNERVLVTPCNHMFHDDCLVPWVSSHGRCPVCRFAFCERRERAMSRSDSYDSGGGIAGGDGLGLDLVSLIRAMEEALNWVEVSR